MIQIFYNGKKYEFSNEIWNKYCEMHPIRTREALLSTLKICYPQSNPSITEIEKLISKEYDLYSNMDFITQKARKKYDKYMKKHKIFKRFCEFFKHISNVRKDKREQDSLKVLSELLLKC